MRSSFNFLRLILTLSYSQVFHKALTAEEVYRRQIALSYYDVMDRSEVAAALEQLHHLGLITESQGRIWPTQIEDKSQPPDLTKLWQTKTREAQTVAATLARLPWVQAVALTGSIAAGSAKPNDDCDFFIITTSHSLWLTRLMVLLFAKFKGKRRSFAKEEPNSWCFNMWLSDNNLILPVQMRSLYTAYELGQAVWLVNKNLTAERFIAANAWARRLLPAYYVWAYERAVQVSQKTKPESIWHNWWVEAISLVTNWLCYLVQYLYMWPHKTSEWVGYQHAFFHPRPTGQLISNKWQNAIEYFLYSETEVKPKKTQPRVLVTGVFDLLHSKHRQLLSAAAKLGDVWVGVETDIRVRRLKGWDRPFEPAWLRALRLSRRTEVRHAFVLPEEMQLLSVQRQLLSKIRPDILAVSASTPNLGMKRLLMAEVGGRVVTVMDHDDRISTTQIAQGKSQYK